MVRHSKIRAIRLTFSFAAVVVAISMLAPALRAQNAGGSGRVVTLSGQVSLERDRGELWAVTQNSLVQPGQVIVTGADGYALLKLDDGSTFEVFGNSRVIFRANRGDPRDLLDVILGKIKVHIEKLGGRPNPYRVNSATALIAVRGTVFDVTVGGDEATTVYVEEGQVAVSHKLLPSSKDPILLNPGQGVTVWPSEPLAKAGASKASLAARIIVNAIDQAIRSGRLGVPGGSDGGRVPVPSGGGTIPGGGTGTGDMGQTPTPPSGGIPGDDTGPGNGLPPGANTPPPTASPAPSPAPPATSPAPAPPSRVPTRQIPTRRSN